MERIVEEELATERLIEAERKLSESESSGTWSPTTWQQRVVCIDNVSQTFNCDRLFNLMSLFGNVERVRMDRGERRSLVEMRDATAAALVVEHLHGATLFRRRLRMQLFDSSELDKDRSRSRRDYSTSLFNRFDDIYSPTYRAPRKISRELVFSNVPNGVDHDEDALLALIERCGCLVREMPRVEFWAPRGGRLRFDSIQMALETVAACNNVDSRGQILSAAPVFSKPTGNPKPRQFFVLSFRE